VPPLRFSLVLETMRLPAGRGESPSLALHIAPVSLERDADRQAVMTLAAQCRSADPAGHFAPAGLLSELNGRPGRAVCAWLAWPSGAATRAEAADSAGNEPLGLVALVAAGTAAQPRISIAWLLVHPDARRRGIATVLVAHAVAHAESLGATRVSAETLSSWQAAVGFWRSVGCEQES
jgi:ribosomal protein S18 acetylase RimI-like enzyme